ncbi:MAG: FmdE, Molybdenum formylmethanofuran dehydrogenase operon [Syntrophorhabdus sp. PtaU1.Bin058]|nr:MAG: FmdE, Molybdenum formylmethanofuran dehydrogenase operon [Syntrophorhabdus sp. PtaU1.Bin058]
MKICAYTFEEFVERAKAFHGVAGPGLIIGGFMVDLAYENLPAKGFFNALCETPKCLPDAIQLLTPCTVGNGRLTVINVGRYAMTLYDKSTGAGVRVYMDSVKVGAWPELKSWLFKLKPKEAQDDELIMKEIKEAGSRACSVQYVNVAGHFTKKERRGEMAVCPGCREGYPAGDGHLCLACQGKEQPYEDTRYRIDNPAFIAEKPSKGSAGISGSMSLRSPGILR